MATLLVFLVIKFVFQVVFVLFALSSDLPGRLVIVAALFLVWYIYYIYARLCHALHCGLDFENRKECGT